MLFILARIEFQRIYDKQADEEFALPYLPRFCCVERRCFFLSQAWVWDWHFNFPSLPFQRKAAAAQESVKLVPVFGYAANVSLRAGDVLILISASVG